MRKIKVVDMDELEDKLLHTTEIVLDQLARYTERLTQIHREFGFPPELKEDGSTDDLLDEYDDKHGILELDYSTEKEILKAVYDYLMKEYTE